MARRIIFALLAAILIAVMLSHARSSVPVTAQTQGVYDAIAALDSGAVVMMSFDHEAATIPEVGPLASAIADHCFRRGIRVIGLALFAEGNAAGHELLARRAAAFHRVYGTDWVYLGYRPQYTAAILGMGESIRDVFPADDDGRSLDSLPLTRRVHNYHDVNLIVSIADGSMPTYWVEYAGARYHTRIVAALSAVMVTSYIPYLGSGQLAGIVNGLRGAAEYEQLLNAPGAGARGMAAQSAAHALIALLVIVGNVEAWRLRRRSPKRDRKPS